MFDSKRLDHETNLAYQLRILHINNTDRNKQIIGKIKIAIEEIIGLTLINELEFLHPMVMSLGNYYSINIFLNF